MIPNRREASLSRSGGRSRVRPREDELSSAGVLSGRGPMSCGFGM
jgi:hypothetical protein